MPILRHKDILQEGKVFDELIKEIENVDKVVIGLKKSLGELITVSKNVNKEGTGAEAKARIEITKQLSAETDKLIKAEKLQQQLIKTQTQQQIASSKIEQEKIRLTKAQASETQRLAREAEKLRREAEKAAKANEKLNSAYAKLNNELTEARKKYKDLAASNKENSKEAQALLKNITVLDTRLKKIDDSIGLNQRSVGKYRDALKNLGTSILGAGGIVIGVETLVQAGQAFIDKAKELNDITRKLNQSFKLTGNDAKNTAVNISAIASTFDTDYNEVLNSAITVSKELGISVQQATKFIEDGFLKGSNNSGQFLDILKEYPTQFKATGIDAETMFAIINKQVTEGIYSDKGVDAIKEAGLRLRENTKAVQDALAPLDEATRAQIKQEIAAGNSFKAIQLVSKALSESGLTAQQTQTIIADIFGGPGEDAGLRYLQTLKDIDVELYNTSESANESAKSTLELNKSWDRFVSILSDDDGLLTKAWNGIKDGLGSVLDYFSSYIEEAVTRTNIALGKLQAKRIKETKEITTNIEEIIKKKQQEAKEQNKVVQLTEKQRKELEKIKKLKDKQLKKEAEANADNIEFQDLLNEVVKNVFDPKIDAKDANKELDAYKKRQKDKAAIEKEQRLLLIGDLVKMNKKFLDKQSKDEAKAIVERIEFKKRLEEATFNEITKVGQLYTDSLVDTNLAKKQNEAEAEKDILKDKLDKGLITETEYKRKLREIDSKIKTEEAKADKKKALYDIAVATAVAAVKALPNLLKVASTIAIGGIQAALVAARPIPKFAKGGWHKGKSHAQGGEIVEVESGEFTVNKFDAAKAPKALEMINNGMLSDKKIESIQKDYDSMILRQLQKSENTNRQILNAISNGVYQYELDGIRYTVWADGSQINKKHVGK